jgi:N-acetylglucosaminyl-diphospho-decaprenol L-rhamnosyltransferase
VWYLTKVEATDCDGYAQTETLSMKECTLDLAVIIVNFRTPELVSDCVESLICPGTMPSGTRIVVVDGNSGDHSVGYLTAAIDRNSWRDRVDLLPLDVNGGFAYANNRGIEYAKKNLGRFRYFLLLNPDTIARVNSVTLLLEFMKQHPDAGISGSLLEDPDGTPQACAFRFPSIASEFEGEARLGPISRLLDRWRVVPELPDRPSQVGWVSGASMMVRADVFDALDGMDEHFFLYYEEVDFCLRAVHAGWSCWHVPQSRVVHLVGQATGVTRHIKPSRRPHYWFVSRRFYFLKHYGRLYWGVASASWLSGHLLWRLRLLLERKRMSGPPHILQDFLRHLLPN